MGIFFEVIKRLFILSLIIVTATMWIMVFASDNNDNNNDDNDDSEDSHGKT